MPSIDRGENGDGGNRRTCSQPGYWSTKVAVGESTAGLPAIRPKVRIRQNSVRDRSPQAERSDRPDGVFNRRNGNGSNDLQCALGQ